MKKRRRVLAAILIAALCAPGTWLRSDVTWDPPDEITVTQIVEPRAEVAPGWELAGVWEYRSTSSLLFGGFSALSLMGDDRLQAFSDRGARFVFDLPDSGEQWREVVRQPIHPDFDITYVDIESTARDTENGAYWIALENAHGIHRYTADHMPDGVRELDGDALGWTNNTGAEAMARLDDGRFVILPEGRRVGLIYDSDPVEGGEHQTFAYLPPVPGHGATDLAQMPDGRVLLLLRNLDWPTNGMPPFESKIAIGPAPVAEEEEPWAPEITLDLAGVIPRENYEGIAVREREDGRVAVWLISDDNMSIIQRTLVAKLIFDPAAPDE